MDAILSLISLRILLGGFVCVCMRVCVFKLFSNSSQLLIFPFWLLSFVKGFP